MSDQFQEPDVLWTSDRTWKDKAEAVRLERGEYQGKPTYKLRIMWKTPDNQWRWSQARPATSGKTWAEFGLKAKELESLGRLLIAESKSQQPAIEMAASTPAPAAKSAPKAPSSFPDDDDIPF